jgi:ubiquitin C-terminal hydrolase
VLVHSGTAESGHYYSYIRDTEKWYEFNDSTVSEFNIANLKSETFGTQLQTKAEMLICYFMRECSRLKIH